MFQENEKSYLIIPNYLTYHLADVYLVGCVRVYDVKIKHISYHVKINEQINIGENGKIFGTLKKKNSFNWCVDGDVGAGFEDDLYFYLTYKNDRDDALYFSPIYVIKRRKYDSLLIIIIKPNFSLTIILYNLAQNTANIHPDTPSNSTPTTTPMPTTTEINFEARSDLVCQNLSSKYDFIFEQYKLTLITVIEMEKQKSNLEEELKMYKNSYEGLIESLANGTRKSTNNLTLVGKTILNENPVHILNEIIRYIVGIPKSDYKITESQRLANNTGVVFAVENYRQKLNILAQSHFRLMSTKFRILNTDRIRSEQ